MVVLGGMLIDTLVSYATKGFPLSLTDTYGETRGRRTVCIRRRGDRRQDRTRPSGMLLVDSDTPKTVIRKEKKRRMSDHKSLTFNVLLNPNIPVQVPPFWTSSVTLQGWVVTIRSFTSVSTSRCDSRVCSIRECFRSRTLQPQQRFKYDKCVTWVYCQKCIHLHVAGVSQVLIV